jgi:predicted AAA+ superfamily ATPase
LLVLDEVQKVPDWSTVVKLLWDADTHSGLPLKVVLLGSAPLLIQSGLTESLAGRFEIIAVPHWSFAEMRAAFGWSLEQYIFYGAYPGSAGLIASPERWRRYIVDSLIETTISRDILLLTRVDKPALLRRLFHLSCAYSGQILSYQKMLGQLSDAGNTVTLAHYLDLLKGAGMVAGLSKYAHGLVRQRGSSPKLQVLNTALMTAQDSRTMAEARQDGNYWGRLVESCVGAHLLNTSFGGNIEVTYWRERNQEVDFVLHQGQKTVAIEVKSGRRRDSLTGMEAFATHFKSTRKILVGGQGIALEEFLTKPAAYLLQG